MLVLLASVHGSVAVSHVPSVRLLVSCCRSWRLFSDKHKFACMFCNTQ